MKFHNLALADLVPNRPGGADDLMRGRRPTLVLALLGMRAMTCG